MRPLPDYESLKQSFYRSLYWAQAKESEAYKAKYQFRNAIRDYIRSAYGHPDGKAESELLESAAERVEFNIRSDWSKKRKENRAKRKRMRKRKLLRLAERSHRKYKAAEKAAVKKAHATASPSLLPDLPVQHRPINPNRVRK
jgi:hypothetical protein